MSAFTSNGRPTNDAARGHQVRHRPCTSSNPSQEGDLLGLPLLAADGREHAHREAVRELLAVSVDDVRVSERMSRIRGEEMTTVRMKFNVGAVEVEFELMGPRSWVDRKVPILLKAVGMLCRKA